MNDATSALIAGLRQAIGGRAAMAIEEVSSRAWASVTFSGARHELSLRLEGEAAEAEAERFLTALDRTELPISGHILADLSLVSQERRPGCARIRLEALTVCDA